MTVVATRRGPDERADEETTMDLCGRHVVVVGAGRSGLAAVELLLAKGARVTLSEAGAHVEMAEALAARGVALELGGHRRETLAAADLVVLSPGVSPRQPEVEAARRAGVPVVGELELAWRWLSGPVVAVTGTKGKSTTTTLIGRVLEAAGRRVQVGGNIGVPLSAQVAGDTPDTIHVVEVSSFQLETTVTFRPWIAVLLNISPDHLDRHGSVAAYAAAKARIFANQRSSDWAVVNAEDARALAAAAHARARRFLFARAGGLADGITIAGDTIVYRSPSGDRPLVPIDAVRVPGVHLLSDVLAAVAVGWLVGATPEAMTAAIRSFGGLEHVLEPVAEVAGVRFVNDSKATNVEAARFAIASVPGPVVAIMGGRFKGGDLGELRDVVRARARAIVAIGEAREAIRGVLADVVPVLEAATMDEAVQVAFARARPEGTVLLAPACASFDQFRDYAARGRAFKEAVARLAVESGERRER
jgi:UDP-N-acetylmuramoylalanine--D-glutamate ligase